jgi:hypothetical protein
VGVKRLREKGKRAMRDTFTSYKTGLTEMLERLGKTHPRYTEAMTLQSRLQENINQTQLYGDTETRRAERARIVDALNHLALSTVEMSLSELYEYAQNEPEQENSQPLAPGKQGGCTGRIGSLTIAISMWYENLPAAQQVTIIVALVSLVGTLSGALIGVMPEIIARPSPAPTATPTHTPTPSPSPTVTSTPSLTPTTKDPASLVTAAPTERLTSTPLPTITPTPTVAATPTPTASPTPTATCPISIGAEIVVDDTDLGFKKFGNEGYWRSCPYAKAIGGRMQWTYGVIELENYGLWCPELPCSGLYEVYVYIPNTHATIEDARYRMHCREDLSPQVMGSDIIFVKQAKEENSWVSLGRSWFEAGSGDCVCLTDVTDIHAPEGTSFCVGFDAMKWVLRDLTPQPEQ